jgi:hypothetical protein
MDKRIAICLMAALMVLVVTSAFAPGTGEGVEEAALDQQKAIEELGTKLDTVLANQKLILDKLNAITQDQETLQKDVTYLRSKTH